MKIGSNHWVYTGQVEQNTARQLLIARAEKAALERILNFPYQTGKSSELSWLLLKAIGEIIVPTTRSIWFSSVLDLDEDLRKILEEFHRTFKNKNYPTTEEASYAGRACVMIMCQKMYPEWVSIQDDEQKPISHEVSVIVRGEWEPEALILSLNPRSVREVTLSEKLQSWSIYVLSFDHSMSDEDVKILDAAKQHQIIEYDICAL